MSRGLRFRRRTGAEGTPRRLLLIAVATTVLGTASGVEQRRAFLLRALDFGGLSNSMAVGMQQDPYPESRELAVRALASVADPTRLRLLHEYSKDTNARARYQAMVAAGRIGPKALPVALAGLSDSAPLVRQSAAWAATHGGDEAFERVMGLLAGESDPTVVEVILGNAWRFGDQPWERHVARYASNGNPVLRRAAAYSLARSDRPARSAALERLARDTEPVIRATALAGFGRGRLSAGQQRLVGEALDDPDWRVQAAACEAVAAQTDISVPDDAAAKLASLWGDRRAQLAVPALGAAAALPTVGDDSALLRIAEAAEPWPATAALQALARRGSPAATELADSWLDSGIVWRRRAAARAVAALPKSAARAKLEKRVWADPAAAVRLARLESMDDREAAGLEDALWDVVDADPDAMVRARAIELLGGIDAVDSSDRMLELAGVWAGDEAPDARAAALAVALAIADGERRPRVIEIAFDDPDRTVAMLVAAEARKLGLDVAAPTGDSRHGGVWYRDLVEWTVTERWLDVVTVRGTFRIRLELDDAPITAREVWDLASAGFYDDLVFHRVVPNFVVQGGDPRGDGWGGPGFVLPDEPSLRPFDVWRVGIATSGPQTGGCQFFVTLLPADRLTGHYTNFGEVVAGREVLARLQVDDRIVRIDTIAGVQPPPPTPVLLDRLEWSDLAALDGWEDERNEYQPDPVMLDWLWASTGPYRVYTILGTWCSDSLREVPRLQRILELAGGDRVEHVMVGVDRTKRVFDESVPPHLLTDSAVARVPTIIVTDGEDQEVGRIVETAERPIEELLADYLARIEGSE
jgi:cyclophilin family peptidyl-prolyl cis-trans isomerase